MSRQNKVNPGTYTQRGRLTQDDAARELRKQSAIGSPHTWQPANTKRRPWLAIAARDKEGPADQETTVETSPQVKRRPASRVVRKMTATKAAPSNTRAKAAKAETARTRESTRTTGRAKTGKARTAVLKPKPTRKAAPARNAGGRGTAARRTTARRKS
jgi:hypothetical protein